MYDYLIVGAGLFGATVAHELNKAGKKVLVIERRSHIGGNVYTEKVNNINVHKYGAHIFHTNKKNVWEYIQQFATFNSYINSPKANYYGEIYSLPFNMNTFKEMWGVIEPDEAKRIIDNQRNEAKVDTPQNLEEQAISLVGTDIYEKLIKGYTKKQWGRECKELPAFIIKRLPVRFTYDNNYFNAKYQGIPVGGYTKLIENMLEGIEVILNADFLKEKDKFADLARMIIYTGSIDEFYEYCFGCLEYRKVTFELEKHNMKDYQSNAVINYTDADTPWTRIIEHKWFEFGKDENGKDIESTVISKEYSTEWVKGDEPYYPVNDEKNNELYSKYQAHSLKDKNIIFGGRLGEYKYYDMDVVIEKALGLVEKIKCDDK